MKSVQIRGFSGPYFHVFGLNTEIYGANLRIQSEYRKIGIRKNSVFGHFSSNERRKKKEWHSLPSEQPTDCSLSKSSHPGVICKKICIDPTVLNSYIKTDKNKY